MRLAAEGASVVFNSSRTAFDGAVVASEATTAGGTAIYVRADVSREADVNQLAEVIRERYGRIDVVVHNAADGREAATADVGWGDFERSFRTNAYALIMLARSLTPLMTTGKFLYVSSLGSVRALPGYGVIGASKAAGEALVRSLAMELAPDIQVNGVRPAVFPTVSLQAFSLAEQFLEMAKTEAPGGAGSVDDIVRSALFLCGPEAGFVTGQMLAVDGGLESSVFRQSWTLKQTSGARAASNGG